MQPNDHLNLAMQIAAEADDGQTDKLGNPYFEHCQRVASAVSSEDEKIVAFLHDVVETPLKLDAIDVRILDAVRRDGRIASTSRQVKMLSRS